MRGRLKAKAPIGGPKRLLFFIHWSCLLACSMHPIDQTGVHQTLNFKEERNQTIWLIAADRAKSKPAFHQIIAQYKQSHHREESP